jgi:hypothetical protein
MKRARVPAGDESGFVLVGVVVFVIALTILGLSLFSLSGFEAQFLGHTLDEQQAFYTAQGGIERAKFALETPPYQLQNVSQDLPLEGVTALVASQVQNGDTVSTGRVDWTATNYVRIRATGVSNGTSRTTEGWYSPRAADDYYRRLITTPGGITVPDKDVLLINRLQSAFLGGQVWEQGASDSLTWKSHVALPAPTPIRTDVVPTPLAHDFITGHRTLAVEAPYNPANGTFTLTGTGNAPTYYVAPSLLTNLLLSLYSVDATPTIKVNGRVVWLFQHGMRFENHVKVIGQGQNDCLVIVAEAGEDPFPPPLPQLPVSAGIWFFGGIESSTVPVILVSDADVRIEHFNDPTGTPGTNNVAGLSIFASSVFLMGPTSASGQIMQLHHVPGSLIDDQIDWLSAPGRVALPNVTNGRRLTLVADSWRDLTP